MKLSAARVYEFFKPCHCQQPGLCLAGYVAPNPRLHVPTVNLSILDKNAWYIAERTAAGLEYMHRALKGP